MSLATVDLLFALSTIAVTSIESWRGGRRGLVTGLVAIWIGWALWAEILAAADPERPDLVDPIWVAAGWIVPAALTGIVVVVRRTARSIRSARENPTARRRTARARAGHAPTE